MASGYRHVTPEQRYTISVMLASGKTQRIIAETIGVSPSTVSREIRRNGRPSAYDHERAQTKARRRQKHRRLPRTFTVEVRALFEALLQARWSPEQINGFCRLVGLPHVSIERMYQHIWTEKKRGGKLYTWLRQRGRQRHRRGAQNERRGVISDRRMIAERPTEANERSRTGDWEIDTVIGKSHQGAVVSMVDRQTCYTKLRLVKRKTAEAIVNACTSALSPRRHPVHSITVDNGKEFTDHKSLEANLKTKVYFADPYCSWQRGTNENLNGLLRQYIPKRRHLSTVSEKELQYIEDQLNSRPRKKLGFLTPYQVYFNHQSVALRT